MEKQGERIEKSKGAPSPGKKTAGLDLLSRSRPHSFVDLGGDAVIQSRTFEHKLKRGQIALSACYCMQFHYIFGRHGKWHGGHMENQQLRRKLVNQLRVSWLSAGAPTPEAFGMWTYTTRSTLQGKLQVGYFQKIGWRMAESCCFDMWKKDLRSWACWRLLCAGVTITHWSLKPRHVEVTWGLWCGYVWNRTGDYILWRKMTPWVSFSEVVEKNKNNLVHRWKSWKMRLTLLGSKVRRKIGSFDQYLFCRQA